MVTLQLRQLKILPNQTLCLSEIGWLEFDAILTELGDRRSSRIAYYQQNLEIRMPSPEHEIDKEIIGDVVKNLLEELEIDRECFGSTTFRREEMSAVIEPDNCFYIQNYHAIVGKTRIDLTSDPPPDLAIEVDVTSKTQLSAYASLGVPEVWIYAGGKLQINLLQAGEYIVSLTSPTFPELPILPTIEEFIDRSRQEGTSSALRKFRQWVRQFISNNSK
jgi:Uma2 family endonuclease